MALTNQEIVDKFFEAYSQRDFRGLLEVMAEDVRWSFLGKHKLAGVKNGLDEVVSFFDIMGGIMSKSNPTVKKLLVCSNNNYLVECQHIKTNRDNGINIDHHVCVLWEFENGKIISGRHFFADPESVDGYFNQVAP